VDVVVNVPGNNTPTANAGADQTVASAAAVTLTGAASSDPDAGQTLTYLWTQTGGTSVTLSSSTAQQPNFKAPTLNIGDPSMTLTFSLVVNDGSLSSTASAVNVTVTSPAEVITWASSGQIGEYFDYGSPSRQSVSVQLSATSNSGGAITYDTNLTSGSLPPGLSLNASGLISGSTTAVFTTTDYTFTVTATSATGGSSVSGPLTIKVRQPAVLMWRTTGASLLAGDPEAASALTNTTFITPAALQSGRLFAVGGGGGGGGGDGGGGGGGGAVLLGDISLVQNQTYQVTIGVGGRGSMTNDEPGRIGNGETGGTTTFGTINAPGGTGGGQQSYPPTGTSGSGGGSSRADVAPAAADPRCNTTIDGIAWYCNSGGAAFSFSSPWSGGGGGGASEPGRPATDPNNGGAGGDGVFLFHSAVGDSGIYVGAGGGGGGDNNSGGTAATQGHHGGAGGNAGVGGNGSYTGAGSDAQQHTGSGGGGGGYSNNHIGGNGADGVVYIVF